MKLRPSTQFAQDGAADGQVWAWDAASSSYVPVTAGGGSSLTVQDENGNVSTSVAQIDFQGAGVAATLGTGEVVVTIPGASAVTASTQTGSYTLALGDAGTVVEVNSASASTVTIPPNSSVAFPTGTVIEVCRYGTGSVAIAGGAGVTVRAPAGLTSVAWQYGSVVLRKRATDEWMLEGDLT